jgi:hypothetical protein
MQKQNYIEVPTKKIKDSKDNVRYNLIIQPTAAQYKAGIGIDATTFQNLSESFVETPEDYYVAVERFTLPIDAIPICFFSLDQYQSNALVSNLIIGVNVGGSYPIPSEFNNGSVGGTNFLSPVMYTPPSSLIMPKGVDPLVSGQVYWFSNAQAILPFYWIYSIQSYIDMFNAALNTSLIAAGFPLTFTLVLSPVGSATTGAVYIDSVGHIYTVQTTVVTSPTITFIDTNDEGIIKPPAGTLTLYSGTGDATLTYTSYTTTGIPRPYYQYDEVTNLIVLHFTDAFLETGMKIVMNSQLVNYLSSFNLYHDVTPIQPPVNNAVTLYYHDLREIPPIFTSPYSLSEDYISIALWFDLRKVIVTSNSLPSTPEIIPSKNSNGDNTSTGSVVYNPILTDFAVDLQTANDLQSVLIYNPTILRLTDLSGKSPISRIDITFSWQDRFGNQLVIPINSYQQASIKLLFVKKSLYNNNPTSF